MNKTIETALKKNILEARNIFFKEYKKIVSEDKIKEEIILSDVSSGTLYISSRELDLPEILIQDKKTHFILSYSKDSKTFTTAFDKKEIKIKVSKTEEIILNIKDNNKEESILFNKEDELESSLSYLIYSFLNYITFK